MFLYSRKYYYCLNLPSKLSYQQLHPSKRPPFFYKTISVLLRVQKTHFKQIQSNRIELAL